MYTSNRYTTRLVVEDAPYPVWCGSCWEELGSCGGHGRATLTQSRDKGMQGARGKPRTTGNHKRLLEITHGRGQRESFTDFYGCRSFQQVGGARHR